MRDLGGKFWYQQCNGKNGGWSAGVPEQMGSERGLKDGGVSVNKGILSLEERRHCKGENLTCLW